MLKALSVQANPLAFDAAPAGWFKHLARRITLKSRKFRRPRVINVNGVKLGVDYKRFPAEVLRALYSERYEDKEAKLVRKTLRPGDRVLEIGAGIGFISLLCARNCGADAVLSYEANPENEPFMRRNFALNRLHPQLRMRAVSIAKGEEVLFLQPNFLSTGFVDRGGGRRTTVPCDGIADVIGEFRPNTIVMDVEGAEIDLLPAAPLAGIEKIILETHARIVGEPAIRNLDAYLQQQGFTRPEAHSRGKVRLYARQTAANELSLTAVGSAAF